MGLFRKKGSPYWWACYTVNGKKQNKSTKTTNKRVAERRYMKIVNDVNNSIFEDDVAKFYSFNDMMEKYITEHSRTSVASSTLENHERYANNLKKIFDGVTLDNIDKVKVADYRSMRIADGLGMQTLGLEITFLNAMLNAAKKEWGWIKSNPLDDVKKAVDKRHKKVITRWLLDDEEEELFKAFKEYPEKEWLRNMVIFALHTGMRQGELRGLQWKDINVSRAVAQLDITKNRNPRTVPLNNTAMKLLVDMHSKKFKSSDYIFHQGNNAELTKRTVQRQFSTVIKKAEIKEFRFHDLRHTAATWMVQHGVDLYRVSKILGHSSIKETERYAHHCTESIRDGVMVLDNRQKQGFSNVIPFPEKSKKAIAIKKNVVETVQPITTKLLH